MNWKLAWNSSTTYFPGMVRVYAGQSYKCVSAHSNSQPPSIKWVLVTPWMDNTQTFTASEAISAGMPVAVDETGKIKKATTNIALGITVQDMAINDSAAVVICGIVTNHSWTWTPDLPVYVDSTGTLTQTPPTDALREIGAAVQSNAIVVNPQRPVILS